MLGMKCGKIRPRLTALRTPEEEEPDKVPDCNAGRTVNQANLSAPDPHPSLPLAFWGYESGEQLRQAYFDMYPGRW